MWAEREKMPPILLVCEEAHRYIPEDSSYGFAAAARAVTRLAKEGRKYGISLGLVTQRPAELSSSALSQCGTIFALRLGNERDQDFVTGAMPYAARAMLGSLPSLPTQKAVVAGEGVSLAMRITFEDLPPGRRPRSESAQFSAGWQQDTADGRFCDDSIRRWRLQSRSLEGGPAPL